MKLPVIAALMILLTACQTMPAQDAGSPFSFYGVPKGAILTLNRDLTIPANAVKVFFQNGRQVYGANEYEPFCKFEVLP